MMRQFLTVITLAGLISLACCQDNAAPEFDINDGNLKDRLEDGILENTPKGTYIGTLKAFVPNNPSAVITFSVSTNTYLDVNTTSGVVTLKTNLDREASTLSGNEFLVTFTAAHGDLTTSDEVTVSVLDVNDNEPIFQNQPYYTTVPENTAVGSTVYTRISITDRDIGFFSDISLTCQQNAGNAESVLACDTFDVKGIRITQGNYSGIISLKQPLDFETTEGYILTLQAVDNPLEEGGRIQFTSSLNVVLYIGDEQDTPPFFLETPIIFDVFENSPIGTEIGKVKAQDGDKNGRRPIRIINKNPGGDADDLFTLSDAVQINSPVYGSPITIRRNIDRETLNSSVYTFNVEAIEMENGVETGQRADAVVTINILDVDDNAPTFTKSLYNVTMLEKTNDNDISVVPQLTMLVTDPDEASYGKFNLSILSEYPTSGLFSISPTNGSRTAQVYLNVMQPNKLNYEDPLYRRLTVVVKATDSRNALKSGTATVIINLEDVNDNAPVFSQSNYSAQIFESASVGQFVITITATDEDSGVNSALVYTLRGTGAEKFSINSANGTVTLKEKLDYDAGQTAFYLLFVAQDQGSPKRETSVPLSITVLNVNDLPPVFTQTVYETSVNEEETNLLISITVQARDPEQGTVTYEIVAGNTADNAFKVDRITGVLSLSRGIEYRETFQEQGFYNLTVQAKDSVTSPLTANAYIIVTIIDKNNHGPVFNPSSYFAIIPEITPYDTIIKRVSATDEDSGSNGQIVYSIWSGGLDAFKMDGNAVRLSDKAVLDINDIGIYNITIHATDQGSPQQTASAMLTVNLTDSNNKSPVFTEQSYTGNIQEGLPAGSPVLTVVATDPDSTSDVRYNIIQSSITAKDSSDSRIDINVFDYTQAFEVGERTGIITTRSKLQQSDVAEIEFKVQATDLNAEKPVVQTATAQVLIMVLGTSDQTPYFLQPWTVLNPTYSFLLFEGTPVGEIITTLVAKEGGTDNLITNYQKITGSDPDNYFIVNRTNGEVRLNKDLDYDTLVEKIQRFSVMAISSIGLSATANIIIQIQDINDNAPVFQLPPGKESYVYNILEDISYANQIATIIAKDDDSGSNSDIVYSLSGNGASSFIIYPTGALFVSNGTVLDYETTTVYKLTIHATDNPKSTTSQNQASVPLIINILDVNDNKPKFIESSYNFSIVESYSIYSKVGSVSATDADSGINKEITYSFIFNSTSNKNDLFSIDQDTGVIQVKSSLAGQSARSPFNMIVQAKNINLYSYVNVVIIVSSGQLDNGRPYWSYPRLGEIVSLKEHSPNGTVVARAIAAVRTPGGLPIYSFLMDSTNPFFTKFEINSTTGEIIVIGDLDREDRAVYDLIIMATDSLNSTLQSTRLLTIELEDIDDQLPSFKNCPNKQYEVPQLVSITEGEPVGSYVFKAEACDLDDFPNNAVQYKIYAPENHKYCFSSVNSFFRVNSTSGIVRTTSVIDRELNPSFLVCIQATQLNSRGRRKRASLDEYIANLERREDVLYLLVTVNDLNDEGPNFPPADTTKLYTYVFGLPDSDKVVQYGATDPDASPNNRIRYSITDIRHISISGRERPIFGAFTINHDTGEISVGFPSYKPFEDGYFQVTVKAEDYNDPLMMDTRTFKIYVGDAMSQVRVVVDNTNIDQNYVNNLVKELESAQPGYKFLPTQIRYHKTSSGSVASRTDICMFVVQGDRMMDSYDGTNVLKTSQIQTVLGRDKIVEPGPCEPATTGSLEGWSTYWWVLVAFAIFIFIVTCILLYVVWALYKNYKTYMETRKTYLVQG